MKTHTMKGTIMVLATTVFLTACAPEVGSKAWCEDLKEKPKGDWTAKKAGEFTQSCVFRSDD